MGVCRLSVTCRRSSVVLFSVLQERKSYNHVQWTCPTHRVLPDSVCTTHLHRRHQSVCVPTHCHRRNTSPFDRQLHDHAKRWIHICFHRQSDLRQILAIEQRLCDCSLYRRSAGSSCCGCRPQTVHHCQRQQHQLRYKSCRFWKV